MASVNGIKLQPYEPPFSAVGVIQSCVPQAQLPLVFSCLGESSIEYCRDLRQELDTLLEIWKDVGDQPTAPTISVPLFKDHGLEPSKTKELLIAQVKLLAEELQEKNGVGSENSFQPLDKGLIKYAMACEHLSNHGRRPSTPLRRNDSETSYHTSPIKLKQVRKNINAMDIDNVADLVRDAIDKECRALENDIEFLQNAVEEEHENARFFSSQITGEAPITRMREVCKTLETQILADRPSPSGLILNPERLRDKNDVDRRRAAAPRPGSSRSKLTPPLSPNRVILKPLGRGSLSALSSSPTNAARLADRPASVSGAAPSACEVFDDNQTSVTFGDLQTHNELNKAYVESSYSWLEPSWAKNMSYSVPGSPDSGVSSRPPTRDLATIQSNLETLELTQHAASRLTTRPHSDCGYNTASSVDTSQNETPRILRSPLASEIDLTDDRTTTRSGFKLPSTQPVRVTENVPVVKPHIKPRPPTVLSDHSRGRKLVNNIRFTRRVSRPLRLNNYTGD